MRAYVFNRQTTSFPMKEFRESSAKDLAILVKLLLNGSSEHFKQADHS